MKWAMREATTRFAPESRDILAANWDYLVRRAYTYRTHPPIRKLLTVSFRIAAYSKASYWLASVKE
jgi:hypothetical protein